MSPNVAAAERKARARKIIARLKREYPDATCALHHGNALELAVATILSAQCTDARVNMVTPHCSRGTARRRLRVSRSAFLRGFIHRLLPRR
jgi:endonuclease III